MSAGRPADRGFALLIVLWTLVLITLVVTTMTASGRSDVAMAASLRAATVARAAVDGAVNEAIFHLAAGDWGLGPDTRTLRIGETAVQVAVEDDGGKVNVNGVPPAMMRALLQEVGVSSARAASLTAAMEDYRTLGTQPLPGGAKAPEYAAAGLPYGPSYQAFRTVAEVGLVLGMTPDILARLAPYISVAKVGELDLSKADPVVAHAFAAAGPNGGYPPGALGPSDRATVRITAHSLPPAAGAGRSATIRIAAPGDPGPAYLLMSWE